LLKIKKRRGGFIREPTVPLYYGSLIHYIIHDYYIMEVHGGDIGKIDIFSKILSIGYEIESSSVAKFTQLSETVPLILHKN